VSDVSKSVVVGAGSPGSVTPSDLCTSDPPRAHSRRTTSRHLADSSGAHDRVHEPPTDGGTGTAPDLDGDGLPDDGSTDSGTDSSTQQS
jgi:hypothetical protein